MVGHCDFKHVGTILFHPPNMRPAAPVCQSLALPACFDVGTRVGDKDNKREDDLLDTFCYGIALALGDGGGF
jgi:hypothetical protein